MMRPINCWNEFWFPQSTALRLAICRIVTVGAQLFLFRPPWHKQEELLRIDEVLWRAQWILRPIVKLLGDDGFRSVVFLKPLW